MGIGRNDDVIAILEKFSVEHPDLLVALKVAPFFEPLRNEVHFQELPRCANSGAVSVTDKPKLLRNNAGAKPRFTKRVPAKGVLTQF